MQVEFWVVTEIGKTGDGEEDDDDRYPTIDMSRDRITRLIRIEELHTPSCVVSA